MGNVSIYGTIKANIGTDGKLPHEFIIETKHAPNRMDIMPGAMDVIGVLRAEEKAVKKIVTLLKNTLRQQMPVIFPKLKKF